MRNLKQQIVAQENKIESFSNIHSLMGKYIETHPDIRFMKGVLVGLNKAEETNKELLANLESMVTLAKSLTFEKSEHFKMVVWAAERSIKKAIEN